jgi:phosphatidylglycerol:prolipoprotein diacylglycerol transferase
MSYPRGIVPTLERVHPTPVYEMIMFLAIFFVLWRLRRLERPPWWLFGLYLALAGIERFAIEFVRTNEAVWLGLTEAQIVSVGMVLAGGIVVWALGARRRAGATRI